jgi:glucose-6-phosphate 1-dehydrogenase
MSLVKADLSGEQTICPEFRSPPFALVIFGASGNLAFRKLFPSLYGLYERNLLPDRFYLLGFARTAKNNETFREEMKENLKSKFPDSSTESIEQFLELTYYMQGNYNDFEAYENLQKLLNELNEKHNTEKTLIFYMAVPPNIYCQIIAKLVEADIIKKASSNNENSQKRVVVEKPFGRDLKSAVTIDNALKQIFSKKSRSTGLIIISGKKQCRTS